MRIAAPILLSILMLGGCETPRATTGPDGDPRVQPAAQEPAVQPVVNLGVGVGSGGAHAYGGVGVFQGPFSLYLGF